MKKQFMLFVCLAIFYLPVFANNITISNQTLTDGSAADGYGYVTFDLSWENSWLLSTAPSNWDAAWVFVKYRVSGGDWLPANLHNTGHVAGTGTAAVITVGLVDETAAFNSTTNPGIGAYVYRSSDGTGTFTSKGLKLRWDYGADGITASTTVEVQVFAIEMVRVLGGAFAAGGGGGDQGFTTTTISTADAKTVPTGMGSLGGAAGGYPTGKTAPDNDSWPNGYAAFYCMKYEATQQQYVDFLNTLTQTQATIRKYTLNPLEFRYAITGSTVGSYVTTKPNLACSYLSWADCAAYADWSGLRPMTELEFEKACRGPLFPVDSECAWGTAGFVGSSSKYTLSNAATASEGIATNYSTTVGNGMCRENNVNTIDGPVRVGIFAANVSNTSRASAGASYWGIMELSGNQWERAVAIENMEGRMFTGIHGDGVLTMNGDANASTWPGTNGIGTGWRGGCWSHGGASMMVSARGFATMAPQGPNPPIRNNRIGFRGVRR